MSSRTNIVMTTATDFFIRLPGGLEIGMAAQRQEYFSCSSNRIIVKLPGKGVEGPVTEKKARGSKQEEAGESRFRRLLKRELMKWYSSALYSGKIKPGGKLGRQP
ncbi:MAG: hypothetical protein ACYC4H_04870 [Desulfocucumaceae bacterium]